VRQGFEFREGLHSESSDQPAYARALPCPYFHVRCTGQLVAQDVRYPPVVTSNDPLSLPVVFIEGRVHRDVSS
jgi:hypothetical protein